MSIMSLVETGRRLLATVQLDECYVHRRTVTRGPGGSTETLVRESQSTPCRFGPLQDYEMAATANTTWGAASATVSLPWDKKIAEGDQIESGVDGSMWLVVGKLTPPSSMNIAMRALVREA